MGQVNWDLTRIGKCEHKKGMPSMFVENEDLVFSEHTGKDVIQFWTGKDEDGISIKGWACAHSENDSEENKRYLLKKALDLKDNRSI